MTTAYRKGFRMQMHAERAMLMLPLNVVMIGRIAGEIDPEKLERAVTALRKRHALLAVRVTFDQNAIAWYESDGVPQTPFKVVSAADEDVWARVVREEWRKPFPIETGPLVRVSLVKSAGHCDLVVTGHHVVCDGTSLAYLIKDIMAQLVDPEREVDVLPPPPPINLDTVPAPKKVNRIAQWMMGLINQKWRKQNISFGQTDMERMHQTFWENNREPVVLRWELSKEDTNALVAQCRRENVTVNSALWTAFLAAQCDVQGETPAFRRRAGLAVSTRDKLKVPVGSAFGFYASSLNLALRHHGSVSFWDAARRVHGAIKQELARTDIFRMLVAESLYPTLLDSMYFAKYDGLESGIAKRMLKKMNWASTSYGYSITNVGRVDLPTEYGGLRLEAVYGPVVYSDVNEKVVGVTTVGGRLTFVLTCNRDTVGENAAKSIRDLTTSRLRDATRKPPSPAAIPQIEEC